MTTGTRVGGPGTSTVVDPVGVEATADLLAPPDDGSPAGRRRAG